MKSILFGHPRMQNGNLASSIGKLFSFSCGLVGFNSRSKCTLSTFPDNSIFKRPSYKMMKFLPKKRKKTWETAPGLTKPNISLLTLLSNDIKGNWKLSSVWISLQFFLKFKFLRFGYESLTIRKTDFWFT